VVKIPVKGLPGCGAV